jgi:hypothetical protein
MGCHLTTLVGSTTEIVIPTPIKKRRSLLPALTALFVLSYGLMTMLIVEQGAAIQSQGNLIKVLATDSRELWALKGKAVTDKQTAKEQAQERAETRNPANRAQSTPSTQAIQPHSHNQAGKLAKPQVQLPPVPASDLTDQRRALRTI